MLTFILDSRNGNPHNIARKYPWVRVWLRPRCELHGTTGGGALILAVMRHHLVVSLGGGQQRRKVPPRSLVLIPPFSAFTLRSRNDLKLLGCICNGDCIDTSLLPLGAETSALEPIPPHSGLERHFLMADLNLDMPGDRTGPLESERRNVFASLLGDYPHTALAGFFSPMLGVAIPPPDTGRHQPETVELTL